jgi:hypothetical protein
VEASPRIDDPVLRSLRARDRPRSISSRRAPRRCCLSRKATSGRRRQSIASAIKVIAAAVTKIAFGNVATVEL